MKRGWYSAGLRGHGWLEFYAEASYEPALMLALSDLTWPDVTPRFPGPFVFAGLEVEER